MLVNKPDIFHTQFMFLKKHKQKSNSVFLGLYYNYSIGSSRVKYIEVFLLTK